MAYLSRRGSDRTEIRESRATPRGPRSRTLASFSGPLTPDILDQAAARARGPFDATALVRKARACGVEVVIRAREAEARAFLARLRRRDPIDPVMAGLVRQALERIPTAPLPEEVAEVAEWIGASAAERGAALRDLLDTFGLIAASRPAPRIRPAKRFPRFSSIEQAS